MSLVSLVSFFQPAADRKIRCRCALDRKKLTKLGNSLLQVGWLGVEALQASDSSDEGAA